MKKTPAADQKDPRGIIKKSKENGDVLHHLAFDNSLQANIIFSVSSGKIIAANIAACKLLGYTQEKLLSTNRSAIFNVKESSFKNLLKQSADKGQSTAIVSVAKSNDTILSCEVTSSIFKEAGIKKAIITLTDLSQSILKQKRIDTKKDKLVADNIILAQTKSDVRLAENNEWIKYIAKTSYDVMWDWDIATGDIYVGDSIAEVFGYKVRNNTVNIKELSLRISPEEQDLVEKKLQETLASDSKSWKDSFTIKRQDGSVAFTKSRASIVRDEERKAVRMIGAIQDVSRLQELENKLEAQQEMKEDAKPFLDVLWDWNILTNEICTGEGFEELLSLPVNSIKTDWRNYLHPDDKKAVEDGLLKAITSVGAHWEHTYRLTNADGSIVKVLNRASIFRRPPEKAYRMVGVIKHIIQHKENKKAISGSFENNKSKLAGRIKKVIIELIHYSDEKPQVNYSDYLSTVLQYDYTYLANIFSEVEGLSIQKYIISQKIERVKEFLLLGEVNLTEIAWKLQYSSVAHLSNQFKKVMGLTPSEFKHQKRSNSLASKKIKAL